MATLSSPVPTKRSRNRYSRASRSSTGKIDFTYGNVEWVPIQPMIGTSVVCRSANGRNCVVSTTVGITTAGRPLLITYAAISRFPHVTSRDQRIHHRWSKHHRLTLHEYHVCLSSAPQFAHSTNRRERQSRSGARPVRAVVKRP